jgi:hypothetical protein
MPRAQFGSGRHTFACSHLALLTLDAGFSRAGHWLSLIGAQRLPGAWLLASNGETYTFAAVGGKGQSVSCFSVRALG